MADLAKQNQGENDRYAIVLEQLTRNKGKSYIFKNCK